LFPEGERQPSISVRSGLKLEDLAAHKKLPVDFLQSLGVETTWAKKTTASQTILEALAAPDEWKTLPFHSQWHEVLIRYHLPDGTPAPRHRRRYRLSGRKFCWSGSKEDGAIVPYGLDRLQDAREKGYLILVEGESDCWALWLHGFPALGIPGATNVSKLRREYLDDIERVYLVQEPDDGGQTFYDAVRSRFSSWKSWKGELRRIERPGGAKDVSDLRVRDIEQFPSAMEQLLQSAEPVPLLAAPAKEQTKGAAQESAVVSSPYILGSVDSSTSRLILSTQRTLPTAEAYVRQFYTHPHGFTLRHYAGMLLGWRDSHYREIETGNLQCHILPWLHEAVLPQYSARSNSWILMDFPANPHTVHAAIESLRAYTHLPADTHPPCWLNPGKITLPAAEILPCKSVLFHLPTMTRIEPTPNFFALNGLDYDPCPQALPPQKWLSFIGQTFGRDAESIELLQDWFGYCLTGDTSQQKMLLLIGPKRCGKGTIARVLTRLIGPGNVAGPTTSSLTTDFGLQPLIGKSLAIVSDARFTGNDISTVIERLLCISGEDTLTIDRKHLTSLTMKLPVRFMFLTNELPRLADVSGALAGRFMILRFSESYFGREDIGLTDKLCHELPGILNWAIDGWKRLRERGRFIQPDSVSEVVNDMESLGSPAGAFVRDYCQLGEGRQVGVDVIYRAWRLWCSDQGQTAVGTKQRFGRDLTAAIPNIRMRRNHMTGRFYEGIDLTEECLRLLQENGAGLFSG